MRKILRLLFLLPLWAGCQSDDSREFGIDPDHIAYNDEAPLRKKAFCDDDQCKDPTYEERYSYTSGGKLLKLEVFARNASGKMEIQSYTDYVLGANGLVAKTIRYGKHAAVAGWVPYYETEFTYQNGLLTLEKTYFNRRGEGKFFTGAVEYDYRDGQKIGQKWFDDHNKLSRRVEYGYNNKVVNRETWYDPDNNVTRIFDHKFSGNRRQIEEYLPNSTELLAVIHKTYDEKGRLARQETKVHNMLLCAMMPGLIRYSY